MDAVPASPPDQNNNMDAAPTSPPEQNNDMDAGPASPPDPLHVTLEKFSNVVPTLNKQGRVPFVVDTSGTLSSYYLYRGHVVNVAKLVIGAAMGSGQSSEDIGEEL